MTSRLLTGQHVVPADDTRVEVTILMHYTKMIFIRKFETIIELGAGQNFNTEIANKSFEGAATLRNLGRQKRIKISLIQIKTN
jgi:hypothetical protein